VNLALALAAQGQRTGLLDADLHSPSVAKMLGLRGQPVRMAGGELRPIPGPQGLAVQGMDFFLQGSQPTAFEGPEAEGSGFRSALEDAALADLMAHTLWGELDVLVVDLAPGPDRLPALAALTGRLSGAIAVTIPTEVSLLAVERSVRRAVEAGVTLLGLVQNQGTVVCAHCGEEAPLYPAAPVERAAAELDLPLLARVPFEPRLAAAADAGVPFLTPEHAESPAARAFVTLARAVTARDPAQRRDEW